MSFVSQVLEPGGGVMLLPFVRVVIGLLLMLTSGAAIVGVARVHMIILSVLSGCLLLSLFFFESEFKKVKGQNAFRPQQTNGAAAKTD